MLLFVEYVELKIKHDDEVIAEKAVIFWKTISGFLLKIEYVNVLLIDEYGHIDVFLYYKVI